MGTENFKPLTWQFFIEPLGLTEDISSGLQRTRLAMYYLPKEHALTVVHTLRRIMLGDLTGLSITAIEWLPYLNELSHVDGVKEPMTEILTSFQTLRFQTSRSFHSPIRLRLIFFGPGTIYGKHIRLPNFIKLVNPNQVLMHITTKSVIDITCYLEQGVGFVNQLDDLVRDRNHFLLQNRTLLPLATNFNPVTEASYLLQDRLIENLRFHEPVQLIVWDITTNGTIKPYTALLNATTKASSIFQNININLLLLSENKPKNLGLFNSEKHKAKKALVINELFLPKFILQKIQKYKLSLTQTKKVLRRRKRSQNSLLLKSRQLLRKNTQLVVNHIEMFS